ncbi:hypothetical protein DSO57_1019753 [Entomophthora muscae]|uniref:Uncharacterized protein n=1 Tax=Entomophthora muscae TaxID=34485 RepID=A0ACC2SSU2_9FUNG|nr:hypothetical protein DSO57_1019753 [Entomophthora muscae]
MSGSYNSVPPPSSLRPNGSEAAAGGQDSFADAIAKARAIAAKIQEQHGSGQKPPAQDDSYSRKRGFEDEPNQSQAMYGAPQGGYGYERDIKRAYYGQEQAPSGPPHYGLGSHDQHDQASRMASMYGQPPPYGSSGLSEEFPVPSNLVGLIIGRAGETLKRIQNLSGAKVNFAQDHDPNDANRITTVSGSQDAIRTARDMIDQLINNHLNNKTGGAGPMGGSSRGAPIPGAKDVQLPVPGNRVGLIIGKGGETIRDLIDQSGARINVVPDSTIPNGANVERLINISGNDESIERAKTLIMAIVSGEINTARGSLAMQSGSVGSQPGQEKITIKVPNDKVGLLIGRGGETIKFMQQQSRARITIEVPDTDPAPAERCITIIGNVESIENAKTLIYEKIDGPGAYTSQYDSQQSYGYGYSAAMTPMQPYGAYPYYPVASGYPYAAPGAADGQAEGGHDKTKPEDQPVLPEGASAADQEAYANYYKQLNDYYASYYAALGYTYPQPGTEGYSGAEATPTSQPQDNSDSSQK